MSLVRAGWFVISLPFRAFFWLLWQLHRGAWAFGASMQRRFGQRTTMLALAAVFAAFGLGLATGVIDCEGSSRCIAGWEIPQGLLFVGFAAYLAWFAAAKVPNVHAPGVFPADSPMHYRSEDWRLSWESVLLVLGISAVMYLILVAEGIV